MDYALICNSWSIFHETWIVSHLKILKWHKIQDKQPPSVWTPQNTAHLLSCAKLVRLEVFMVSFCRTSRRRRGETWHNMCNIVLLMEEILHQLGCKKPYKRWDKAPINWCRISSINSSTSVFQACGRACCLFQLDWLRRFLCFSWYDDMPQGVCR